MNSILRQSTPSPLQPSSSSVCSSTDACIIGESEPKSTAEEVYEDGIRELMILSKRFAKWIGFYLQRDWSIVKSALDEHRIKCHLDLDYSSITFSIKRTREPDIVRKARDLLKLLALNIPASRAINVITQPNHGCEIIITGPKNGGLCTQDPTITREDFLERVELLKFSSEVIKKLTSCDVFISEWFVVTIGTLGGLRIVRKIVEDCILYRMPPADNIKFIRMQLASETLEDLRV